MEHWESATSLKAKSRPLRDRAIVFVLLSTGLRREELVNINLDQLSVKDPESEQTEALFLTAKGIPARKSDGRLSKRTVNNILEQIGKWHDAEIKDSERHILPLQPHDLRHTFAFRLAEETGADAYELERRLGHRSQRFIQRYTNPPEERAAKYVEDF